MTGSLLFLWPALMAAEAGRVASGIAETLASLGSPPAGPREAPRWATRNRVVLELMTLRLRDFSVASGPRPTLICSPFALHGATVADFAPGHSLVKALRQAGVGALFLAEWRSATPEMRFLTIDAMLADLNLAVDELGGRVTLVGLCQGGWLALVYTARFPEKVDTLVLVGA
ncbi:MAG: alpha/beta fold hydrolase, partial [Alphaproteobacteria bacterium]